MLRFIILGVLVAGGLAGWGQSPMGLDFYIDQALQNSPLLKDYRNQLVAGQVDSALVRAGYRPQVTGSSVNVWAPTIKGWGYDQAISNGGNFTTVVAVNQTLVGQKHLDAEYETIRLLNQGVGNSAKVSEQDLKKSVTAQYITAYGDWQQLNFNRDVYALLQKEEALLKDLTQKNVYRQTDYLAFLVTLKQEGLLLRQLEIQFRNDHGTLNYLCGIVDTAATALDDPRIELQRLPEIDQSIFFRQFHLDSLKLRNSRSLIDYSYRPKASLYADGGFSSSFEYQGYKNFGVSFGVSVSVPIYDGHQRKMQYSKLDIAERTRAGYKDFFTKQYDQQIAQLRQQLQATEELIGQINEQVKYSQTLIDVNGKLLGTGDARIADYIIALSNYLSARNLLTQNNITRLQIINQINYWNR
ncbi:MAG TPA: TolC family protein [Puia sp.]|uniref:TolC family protein n=1 Tax=Puia sp. TaxID=2045100 RepID=UPI002BD41BE7|nr:TolC family protein [Puia sp.]HVU95581.1 TolC family protein [Puia sp.]